MNTTTKLLAVTSLALFFLAGVMSGVIIDRKLLKPGPVDGAPEFRNNAGPMPGGDREEGQHAKIVRRDFTQRMKQGLELNKDQVKKIDAILDENEKKFEKLRTQMRDGLYDLDYSLFNRISEVLDEKQKKKLLSEWMSPYHPREGGPGQGRMQGGQPPRGPGQDGMRPGMQGGRPPMDGGPGFQGGPEGRGMRGGMPRGPEGRGPGMGMDGRPEGGPPPQGGMPPQDGPGPRGEGFQQQPPPPGR